MNNFGKSEQLFSQMNTWVVKWYHKKVIYQFNVGKQILNQKKMTPINHERQFLQIPSTTQEYVEWLSRGPLEVAGINLHKIRTNIGQLYIMV